MVRMRMRMMMMMMMMIPSTLRCVDSRFECIPSSSFPRPPSSSSSSSSVSYTHLTLPTICSV
eukprot:8488767-Karenia_brevis.AAC.1